MLELCVIVYAKQFVIDDGFPKNRRCFGLDTIFVMFSILSVSAAITMQLYLQIVIYTSTYVYMVLYFP